MIVKRMVGDKPNAPLEQYIVETVDDLAEIISDAAGPRDITRTLPFGSIAFVIDNKTFYMVGFDSNNNKTWIDISESSSGKPEQSKTVTPTKSGVTVLPDTGYALSSVEVEPIPDQYPDVSDVTATAGTVLTGSDFVDASGTLVHGACDYDADTSDADATAGQIEAGATAYVNGTKITGTMPIRTTDVEIDSLAPVPIPAGSYDGTVKARLADPTEVDAQYIAQGHSILGVNGSLVAQDNLPALLRDTLTSVSDATLTAVSEHQFYKKTALESANFPAATSIGIQAFYQCSALESANFPAATSIGNQAFYQCSALESVNFPAATSVDNMSFYQCTALLSISLPEVTTFLNSGGGQGRLFQDCSNLTGAVSFPKLTTIANGSRLWFQNCPKITSFSAPLLTTLASYVFSGCTMLASIDIPSVRTAQSSGGAFDGTALTRIDLPSLESTSGASAIATMFKSANLEIVDIGENIATIGNYTFGNAARMATLIIRASSVPTLASVQFAGTPFAQGGTGGTIYIPESLYNHLGDGTALDYKAATNWSVIDAYGTITWAKIEGSQYEVTS